MALQLLSEPIRRYVHLKRWEQLRPIQNIAIQRIMETEGHYILASRTASGKTEAAFLPILSKVNFNEPGVLVLYISPLIALINDQFFRIEQLCSSLEVNVTKWHGEANKSAKEALLKAPSGIVMITPESLEAMFVNKPHHVRHLFANLKFVVIDEIHSFIGTDRGTQLKSILSRLKRVNANTYRIIGLSATIGDYMEAKRFTGDLANTKVLIDKASREIEAQFRFYNIEGPDLTVEFLEDLYSETKSNKVLIFPNSRGRVEEVSVGLHKIAQRLKGHSNYFSHHSSVDREVREYVEHFAKNNVRHNFCICCTSTLELGIDIGSVDQVVQIDSTHSIASLIQRVGRSGRREGEQSKLLLYATKTWSLLQSLACWELYKEGFIEPPHITEQPYDIFLHQVLSIVKGYSGIAEDELMKELADNFAFTGIQADEMQEIVHHLITLDFLEKLGKELIIGVEGERVVNHKDFYSVFKTEENFKVTNAGNTIGEVPFSPQIVVGNNILLAARIWKILDVDEKAKKIEVSRANDGKKPTFFGKGGNIDRKVREKMFALLLSTHDFPALDELGNDEISLLREDFAAFDIVDALIERPLFIKENDLEFYTFSSTRINQTIEFLLTQLEIKNALDEDCSALYIFTDKQTFLSGWAKLLGLIPGIDEAIEEFLASHPTLLDFSKWGGWLPMKYKILLLKQRYFDFDGAEEVLKGFVIREIGEVY